MVRSYGTIGFVIVTLALAASGRPASANAEGENPPDWELVHKYIDLALPRVDGSNLREISRIAKKVRQVYLTTEAKEAARLLEALSAPTGKPEPPAERLKKVLFVKQHLIQLKISSPVAVFVDDVPAFFKALPDDPKGLYVEELKAFRMVRAGEPDKAVPRKAWIVEVFGATPHRQKHDFVLDALVENLVGPDKAMKKLLPDEPTFVMLAGWGERKTAVGAPAAAPSLLKKLEGAGKLGKGARVITPPGAMKKPGEDPLLKGLPKEGGEIFVTDFSVLLVLRAAE